MFKKLNKASVVELQAWMLSAGFTGFGLGSILHGYVTQLDTAIFLAGLALNLLLMVYINTKR